MFAAVLVAVIAVNTAVFPKIDQLTETQRSKALSIAPTGDFFELAFTSEHSRSRVDLYYALGELAPGSSVVIAGPASEQRLVHTPFLYSLGAADAVEVMPDSPLGAAATFDATEFVVAAGKGGSAGVPWTIAMDPEGSSEGTSREFVLVETAALPGSEFHAHLLLIETSLLSTP
jgi:hypothetical protein